MIALQCLSLFWSIIVNNILKGIRWKKLTVMMVIVALSLVTLMMAIFFYYSSKDYNESSKNKLTSIESRINIASNNSNILYENMKSLEDFYSLDILGEPSRLEWVKTLQDVTEEYDIPMVEFTVSPTVAKSAGEFGAKTNENILETPMMLNIKMMHEGDFYRLLTALKGRSVGLFKVNYCEIKRVNGNVNPSSVKAQFNAVCELAWFNYRDLRQEWFGNEV